MQMSSTTSARNPFPLQAVTTFGVAIERIAPLKYMSDARQVVVDYLKNYPSSGVAVAVSGGHGSGKTFLLNWLGKEAAQIETVPPKAVYAKADNQSLPDMYRQLLRSITRPELINITRAAVRRIGQRLAGAAQATKTASDQIQSEGLQPAYDAKILDPNELYMLLRKDLEGVGVSPAVAKQVGYAVGMLELEFGEAAFTWLAGGNPPLPSNIPIVGPLWAEDLTDAADVAVSALECIAALYRLAETALILILDQMENFLLGRSSPLIQASLVKKLVEQVSGQGALLLDGRHAGRVGAPAARRGPAPVGPRSHGDRRTERRRNDASAQCLSPHVAHLLGQCGFDDL